MNKLKNFIKKPLGTVVAVLVLALLSLVAFLGYVFAVSPMAILNPKVEHAHARLQLVANGTAVNFSDDKYQETYAKGSCSAELPSSPIHFHDNKNQFVHLHWKGMTGGLLLKNYGWNYIGGQDELLGYRLDELPAVQPVPIYGNVLPDLKEDTKLWVYTGTTNDYEERSQEDFAQQDLETFFGKKSTINPESVSLLDAIFPRAYAHDGSHESTPSDDNKSEEELKRINNLLGNVVVFAQNDKPSDKEITRQFNNLEPLTDSVCGG